MNVEELKNKIVEKVQKDNAEEKLNRIYHSAIEALINTKFNDKLMSKRFETALKGVLVGDRVTYAPDSLTRKIHIIPAGHKWEDRITFYMPGTLTVENFNKANPSTGEAARLRIEERQRLLNSGVEIDTLVSAFKVYEAAKEQLKLEIEDVKEIRYSVLEILGLDYREF